LEDEENIKEANVKSHIWDELVGKKGYSKQVGTST
jgi:hypothetical protein